MMQISFLPLDTYWAVLFRLVVSLILGALIGMERGSSKHDAGLRTHIIVCLGSASVMIVSQLIAEIYGTGITDITRLGAQVISGIGFLGAGSIIVTKSRVRGLTTAAGLWTTACLGLVVGAGFVEVAITILFLIMFTTYALRPLSLKLRAIDLTFEVVANKSEISEAELSEFFVKENHEIGSIKVVGDKIVMIVHTGERATKNEFITSVIAVPGITAVSEI